MFSHTASHLRSLHRYTTPKSLNLFQKALHLSSMPSPSAPELPIASNITIEDTQIPFAPNVEEPEFWRRTPLFRGTSSEEFISWRWSVKNIVERKETVYEIIDAVVPDKIPRAAEIGGVQTRDEFAGDVASGIKKATMSIRLTPYVLSRINWADPANCVILRQFLPLASVMVDNHPMTKLDSLHEKADSPVDGVVWRYPDKAIFLPVSVCPVYCVSCTRSYGVGADTELVVKEPFKPKRTRFEEALAYIESQAGLKDIVVSGGDAFYLPHNLLEKIGDRLIGMKNIERFRFATKGLAVAPNRFLDHSDPWTAALIRVSDKARRAGKHMAMHTHFNHPNEISWITEKASRKLSQAGLTVRNQSVLLRGINDNVPTMSSLIKKLAAVMIQPYYVYQCDMVPRVEHMRTPLQTSLDLESEIRGSIAGFYMPNFVVDLPGGGGKRLACSYESYDRATGVSTFRAPALTGKSKEGRVYRYHDPVKPASQLKRP
ncbi:L-lysine-aminomutase [Xylaria venustula]|nr:L-lysine-aminomutase [Xylaria venustula]